MHLIEMQDTTSQIAEAEKAVVDAKEALTQVVVTTPSADLAQGDDQQDVPMTSRNSSNSNLRLPASRDPKAPQWTAHQGLMEHGPRRRQFSSLVPKNGEGSSKENGPGGKGPEGGNPAEAHSRLRSRSPKPGE